MAISEALGKAFIEIRGDLQTLDKDLTAAKKQTEDAVGSIGKHATTLGKGLTAGLTVPLVAIGAAITSAGFQFDEALRTIRVGTGATGKDLEGLGHDFLETWKTGEEGADIVSEALANLNTRTGAHGKVLQDLTRQYINFAGLVKTDVNPLIEQSTGLFAHWGISAEQQGPKLDHLFKVVQSTGVNVNTLMEATQRYGPILRELGFTFEEASVMIGNWDKQGINARMMMAGLSAASIKFAKDNIPVRDGIQAVVQKIVELGPSAESGSVALNVFGKNGLALRDAILSGALSVDDLTKAMVANTETINAADDASDSLSDKVLELKNNVMASLAPIGVQLVGALNDLLPAIKPVLSMVAQAATWFAALPAPVQKAAFVVGGLVAAIGPLLIIIGSLISSMTTIIPVVTAVAKAFGLAPIITSLVGSFKLLLPILGPAGWIVAGVTAVYLAWKHWDKISAIAQAVYTGVKTWIMDKLGGVFDWLKGKLDAVTGFFRNMYQEVVGGSIVPDMVKGISDETRKLDGALVQPVQKATSAVTASFSSAAQGAGTLSTATSNLTAKQKEALAAQMGLTAKHKEGKTASDEYAASLKQLTEQLSGAGVQKEAKLTMDALAKMGSTTGLTRGETEQIVATLGGYLEKMRALGQTTSEEFKRVEVAHAALRQRLWDEDYAAQQRSLMNEIGVAQMEVDRKVMDEKLKLEDEYDKYVRDRANERGLELMEQDRQRMEQSKSMFSKIFEGIGGLDFGKKIGDVILGALQGGGDIGKSVGGLIGNTIGDNLAGSLTKKFSGFISGKLGGTVGKLLGGTLGSIIPGVGTMLGSMLGDFIGKGLSKVMGKIGGWFKGLFGGPSEKEVAGRDAAKNIRQKLADGLSKGQKGELAEAIKGAWKGNELGAATVISLRDAFMKSGLSGDEGVSWADRLFKAEKDGPDAVQKVVDALRGILGENMPQLMFGGIVNAGKGAMAMLHGTEVVAPLDRLQSMMGDLKNDPQDIANALRQAGIGKSIVFSPVFKGTLDHEMKSLIRTKLWPMFLDILKESTALRGDVSTVLGVQS